MREPIWALCVASDSPSRSTWWLFALLWTQVMCDACWGGSLLWARRLSLHIGWNQFCCSAKTSLSHSQMPNTPWRFSHPQWQAVFLLSGKKDVLYIRQILRLQGVVAASQESDLARRRISAMFVSTISCLVTCSHFLIFTRLFATPYKVSHFHFLPLKKTHSGVKKSLWRSSMCTYRVKLECHWLVCQQRQNEKCRMSQLCWRSNEHLRAGWQIFWPGEWKIPL